MLASKRQQWDRGRAVSWKQGSRKGKYQRRHSTSGNGLTSGSISLWHGYVLKWTIKTSVLVYTYALARALFVGSTRLEYAGSKMSLYNVSQWNVSGQHSVVAGCYIVVWQSSGYYEIAIFIPAVTMHSWSLLAVPILVNASYTWLLFRVLSIESATIEGGNLLIKGGVWENSHVCFPVHVRVKRRVDCSCVPSSLDTQSVFHLWPNWKKTRLEMPMNLINCHPFK